MFYTSNYVGPHLPIIGNLVMRLISNLPKAPYNGWDSLNHDWLPVVTWLSITQHQQVGMVTCSHDDTEVAKDELQVLVIFELQQFLQVWSPAQATSLLNLSKRPLPSSWKAALSESSSRDSWHLCDDSSLLTTKYISHFSKKASAGTHCLDVCLFV